ncbi:Topless-related protein 1 [Platanthera guangdongensis]|uniref:Topless-related protein 1 n=1 Tax=Platanthera guangdongensis TaxID=2320717 RepID=A0ABR2M9I9_9ASPA
MSNTHSCEREAVAHTPSEIDAHSGGVNDISLSQPNKQLCVVTCGDDKTIKVWDAITGVVQYTYEGHEAPVYSICPHSKENIHFIFSTSLDGKIKAWLLFSCGTSKEGDSYIVEWNESEGSVKRTYSGFQKRSNGVVQFDTTKNRFLAAGDDFMVKFWDMDNTNLLTTTEADGGLSASPCIRFNKLGSLLAVSTSDNCIKILANAEGYQLLRSFESRLYSAARSASEAKPPLGAVSAMPGVSMADRSSLVAPCVGLGEYHHTCSPLIAATWPLDHFDTLCILLTYPALGGTVFLLPLFEYRKATLAPVDPFMSVGGVLLLLFAISFESSSTSARAAPPQLNHPPSDFLEDILVYTSLYIT